MLSGRKLVMWKGNRLAVETGASRLLSSAFGYKAAFRSRAMDEEDLLPQKKKAPPKPLDSLGVAELEAYIAELEAEIRRARAAIAARQAHKGDADRFFRK
jgi:uncharacterized small protein (DUF1192 family)